MQIKHIGWLMIGIAVILVGIVFLFKSSLEQYIYTTCPLLHDTGATECPATRTLNQQAYLAYFLVSVIAMIGIVLSTIKPEQRIIIKKVKEKKINIDTKDLSSEEKQILNILLKERTIFQADLIEKTQMNKAKVTRILHRLESKNLVERKRRGLTNIVVLK
ncbi:MAG: helix-turn-helix transcriptional regulator [Candidatus Pacearchaeota archaeon]